EGDKVPDCNRCAIIETHTHTYRQVVGEFHAVLAVVSFVFVGIVVGKRGNVRQHGRTGRVASRSLADKQLFFGEGAFYRDGVILISDGGKGVVVGNKLRQDKTVNPGADF